MLYKLKGDDSGDVYRLIEKDLPNYRVTIQSFDLLAPVEDAGLTVWAEMIRPLTRQEMAQMDQNSISDEDREYARGY